MTPQNRLSRPLRDFFYSLVSHQEMAGAMARFDALLEAFEFVSSGQPGEQEAYLCTKTGEFHWHSEYGDNEEPLPDDIEDSEKYIPIPHRNELGLGKPLVLKFAEKLLPDALDKIREIFRHASAYARFKARLEKRGLLQQWYEYEANAQQEALRQWCGDRDIQLDA